MTSQIAPVAEGIPNLYDGHLVSLRPVGNEDGRTVFEWRADLAAFQLFSVPDGVSTYQEFAKHWEAGLRQTVTLFAVNATDGRPIGIVRAYDVNFADGWCFVLSYVIPEYRSQRAGLEATVGFWDYLFTQMNLRKIYMDVVESNTGWLRAVPGLEAGLLHEEGRFRGHVLHGDRYWDMLRLGLYREAWLAIRDYVLPLFRLGAEVRSQDEGAAAPVASQQETRPRGAPGKRQRLSPRVDLVSRYLTCAREGRFNEILGLVTNDVVFTTPLTGSVAGKRNFENLLSFRHRMLLRAMETGAPRPTIRWLQPVEDSDGVRISGTDSVAGEIELLWRFDSNNKVTNISVEAPPELLTAYLLSEDLPIG